MNCLLICIWRERIISGNYNGILGQDYRQKRSCPILRSKRSLKFAVTTCASANCMSCFQSPLYTGYRFLSSSVICRITLHGTPTATTLLGMDFVTTLPAPMTEWSPIVTPARIVDPAPIQTLLPMVMGLAISIPALRCSGSMACSAVVKQQLGAIKTLFPKDTFAPSVIIKLWFA